MPTPDVKDGAGKSHRITYNSRSPENRLLAQRWIENCRLNHKSCNHPRTQQKWWPTRLLDVSCVNATPGTLHLAELISIPEDFEYMSLSHCWGSKPITRLTQANIETLKRDVVLSDLPKIIQDENVIAGWFNCQYLWIDSLCIIQDSLEDWRRESSLMRHVYKNAWINIAATGAVDSSCGLFYDRDPLLVSTGIVTISWDGDLPQGTFHFFLRQIWEHGVGRAPLCRRAWVVQERLLARRNLHFGSDSLFFECHDFETCETFPEKLPQFFKRLLSSQFKNSLQPIHSAGQSSITKAENLLKSWQEIIGTYMDCDLTYASDKVIALSGVAEKFQSINNEIYLAGLWKNSLLVEQLLWRVDLNGQQVSGQPSTRPSIYRAPSWSWLSIDAKISCPVILESSFIDILGANVQLLDDSNPTGQIKHGTLSVCGHLINLGFQRNPETRAEFYLCDEQHSRLGLATISFDEVGVRSTQGMCMPVRICWGERLEGLILMPSRRNPTEFNRVGHFTSDDAVVHQKLIKERKVAKTVFTIV